MGVVLERISRDGDCFASNVGEVSAIVVSVRLLLGESDSESELVGEVTRMQTSYDCGFFHSYRFVNALAFEIWKQARHA